jgi:flagellar hook protein FlgE
MALTTSMFTALTGMNASQFRIDTVGDNIANVNTTAFKSNRTNFENQLAMTISDGTAPSDTTGGTNPLQIGRGTMLGSVQRSTLTGAIETTGVPTDMAVEGHGYFIVRSPADEIAYTRDGTFRVDADNQLVTAAGHFVQGYTVDSDFNIIEGQLVDLTLPLGGVSAARATSSVDFDGNLNADGPVATQGSILESQQFLASGGSPATTSTLMTGLADADEPGTMLFAENDLITVRTARKGDRQLPERTFTVTASSTLGDYLTFLKQALGINQDAAAPGNPGITVSDSTHASGAGRIIIEGNVGEANALQLDVSAIRSSNTGVPNPFLFTETQEATGESLFTSFIAYDSLGTPVLASMTLVLEEKTSAGNTWRFYAESYDDTDASAVLDDTGTLTFDTDGQLAAVSNNTIQIDRANTGAADPIRMTLDFENVTGLTSDDSALVMTTQDGFAAGSLTNFSVGLDGVITGAFSNGMSRDLGKVMLAQFANEEGLVASTNNTFLVGPNSGEAVVTDPGTLNVGRIRGSALELSNVDLTREFIGLITASTAFSASGRVLDTSNDLLNELMLLAR